MTTIPAGSIVVAHDNNLRSAAALAWGLTQASLENRAVDVVHALNVTEIQQAAWLGSSGSGLRVLQDFRDHVATQLDSLVALARHEHPDLRVQAHVVDREPRHALIELSASAHLLVLGSHGRGPLTSPLLGSVSAAVTRQAACPTVVVRPPSQASEGPVGGAGLLVGVDGSAESRPVIEYAFAQASLHGYQLTAVHCVRDVIAAYVGDAAFPTEAEIDRAHTMLAASVESLSSEYPDVPVTRRLGRGLLDQVVNDPAHLWDLVVVGGHRHGAWHRLFIGSTTTAVLERAHCPVAVVPEAMPEHGNVAGA